MARLIVVSGPNGAGKTTLIKNSLAALQQLDYTIIIPDELELQSGSDTPVSDAISYCLQHKKNAIYETPFQYPEIAEQVEKFVAAGYSVVLIQLFLENADNSVIRVKQRLGKGGRNIPSIEVKQNFEGNFKNIIRYHHLFNQSYFVHASDTNNYIVAELQQTKINYYFPVQSVYISDMLYEISMTEKGNKESLAILKNNKLFGGLTYRKMVKALRFVIRLKK
jgi:predicted ABC-type ATPase